MEIEGLSATLVIIISLSQFCYAKLHSHRNTYEVTLDNGQNITCNLCEPGMHWKADCVINGGDAQCEPCSEGFFSPEYNRGINCAPCSKECDARENVVSYCTKDSNISCKCKDGYYREPGHYGVCRTIDTCPPGRGVITTGNESYNTVCGECLDGYFSDQFSATEACKQCSLCPPEMMAYKQCKPNQDTVCRPVSEFPTDPVIIGIIVGVVLIIGVVITLVCCLCLMKERCANIRKVFCKCCYRPYQECTQNDQSSFSKSAHVDDVKVNMPPDILNNTQNGIGDENMYKEINGTAKHVHDPGQSQWGIDNSVFFQLREDLISQDYPQFFRFLFTNGADTHIDEMKMNHISHGVKEIIYQILVRWRDIEREQATSEKILSALKDWNRMDLHKKYADMFRKSEDNMDKVKRNSLTTEV